MENHIVIMAGGIGSRFWYDTIEQVSTEREHRRKQDGKGVNRGRRCGRADGGGCRGAAGARGDGAGAHGKARPEDPCHRQGPLQRDQRLHGGGIPAPCADQSALPVLLAGGVPASQNDGAV